MYTDDIMTESKFTTVRVPTEVKEQAEKLREVLQKREDLKWVGVLALGAVIGYAIAKILEEETKDRR